MKQFGVLAWMTIGGLLTGGILGAIYGVILSSVFADLFTSAIGAVLAGIFAGGIYGGIGGLMMGGVAGVVLAFVVTQVDLPLTPRQLGRVRVSGWAACLLVIGGVVVLSVANMATRPGSPDWDGLFVVVLVPAGLAALAAIVVVNLYVARLQRRSEAMVQDKRDDSAAPRRPER